MFVIGPIGAVEDCRNSLNPLWDEYILRKVMRPGWKLDIIMKEFMKLRVVAGAYANIRPIGRSNVPPPIRMLDCAAAAVELH